MCCYANRKTKEDFLAEMKRKRRKIFTAWKVIRKDGGAIFGNHQYCPGTHTAEVTEDTYDKHRPQGIHVFYDRDLARYAASCVKYNRLRSPNAKFIPVQCHIDDLVIMDYDEMVLRKIHIDKKRWNKGLVISHNGGNDG